MRSAGALLAGAFAGVLAGGVGGYAALRSASHDAPRQTVLPRNQARTPSPLSFSPIVSRVLPAVVSVSSPSGPPQVVGASDTGAPIVAQPRSLGSGFFISSDGYAVTNAHVVGAARQVVLTRDDGRRVTARVLGVDAATDLALMKADVRAPYVRFSTLPGPHVGDWVIAVGSPFGLGGTATAGIVSAYNRDIGQPWVSYLQIDAPINRGNSGGPTFDVNGEVVGVNTAIFSPSGGSVGIGFAIPAALAQRVVGQLKRYGKVTRGYLGATAAELVPNTSDAPTRGGAYIVAVDAAGPGAKAGLRPGDVVLRMNGQMVRSGSELMRLVAEVRPGDELRLLVARGGGQVVVSATASNRPDEAAAG